MVWAAIAAAVLSGFFSLNGYVLRDSGRRELEAAFEGKDRRRLPALVTHQSELQMTCALLRLLCNLALLVVMLYVWHAAPHDMWSIASSVGTTAAILAVCSVAIPHAWARYAGARVLVGTGGVLLAIRVLLWPLVKLMKAFDLPIRRLSGVPDPLRGAAGDEQARAQFEDAVNAEIMHVAEQGRAEGAVDAEEVEMIESVIAFGDRRASEIMTPRTEMIALPADSTATDIRAAVTAHGHTRIPIYDGDIDNIVGILHVKDMLTRADQSQMDLRKLMRKPFFVPQTKRLDHLMREFKAGRLHLAIVLDEYGGTAGMVTIEDLIEEIVGEISDEHDRAESPLLKRLSPQAVEVDGRLRIDELNDVLGLELPDRPEYDTVAGLVFSELGFVPPVGETLMVGPAKFTILAADARRISKLRVELPEKGREGKG